MTDIAHLWKKETLLNIGLKAVATHKAEYELPDYGTPGNILVRVRPLYGYRYQQHSFRYSHYRRREYEVLDYNTNSGIFWLQEGVGIEYWLDNLDFPPGPGVYVVVGVHGEYTRGTWGYDDDYEEWYFKRIRRAFPSEIKHECL